MAADPDEGTVCPVLVTFEVFFAVCRAGVVFPENTVDGLEIIQIVPGYPLCQEDCHYCKGRGAPHAGVYEGWERCEAGNPEERFPVSGAV